MGFIQQNLPTILVGAVVLAIAILAAVSMLKKRKKGGSCGCACSSCPYGEHCK